MAAWPLPAAPSLLGWGPAVSWCCWPWRRPCGAGLRPGPPSRHCPRGRTSWLNRYGGGVLGRKRQTWTKGGEERPWGCRSPCGEPCRTRPQPARRPHPPRWSHPPRWPHPPRRPHPPHRPHPPRQPCPSGRTSRLGRYGLGEDRQRPGPRRGARMHTGASQWALPGEPARTSLALDEDSRHPGVTPAHHAFCACGETGLPCLLHPGQ